MVFLEPIPLSSPSLLNYRHWWGRGAVWLVWYGIVHMVRKVSWYGMVWYGLNGKVWYGMVWYVALQDMQTFKNQAKILLPFLVMLLLVKVSNCAKYMLYMKMTASSLATSGYQP